MLDKREADVIFVKARATSGAANGWCRIRLAQDGGACRTRFRQQWGSLFQSRKLSIFFGLRKLIIVCILDLISKRFSHPIVKKN
jgi:hypothetical protein